MNPTLFNSRTKWSFLAAFVITAVFTFLQTVLKIQIEEAIVHWVVWFVDGVFVLMGVFGMRNAVAKAQNEFYQTTLEQPKFEVKNPEIKGTIPMGNSKSLISIIFALTMLAGVSFTIIPGCTSYTQCYDCTEKPLSWQSEITGITNGKYIHTACGTINLDLVKIFKGDFKIGDILKFSYVIKQGEFCAPGDKSIYKIEAETNTDIPSGVIYTEGKAILK